MEVHRLANGTKVRIRPIEPADKQRLALGLTRLSDETVYKRFLAAKPRFSSSELRYLTEVDGRDHIALVAVLDRDPDWLVAVARCVRLQDRPDTADIAIVVADPLQGQGLGRRLAGRLAEEAAGAGIRRFSGTLLGSNVAALRLMRSLAPRFEQDRFSGGLREIVFELAPQPLPVAA